MNSKIKTLIFFCSIVLCGFLLACSEKVSEESNEKEEILTEETTEIEAPIQYPPSSSFNLDNTRVLMEVFNDSNKYQYAYAEKLGLTPIESIKESYFTSKPVVSIRSCDEYQVDSLTHSMPFLVPEAAALLSTIGRNFLDSLQSKKIPKNKIIVTSLLRTSSSVRKLRRVNVNATDSSTHKFGTTFDLSYRRFYPIPPDTAKLDLRGVLAQVLYDLRNQGRCLVKYENKTGCFHITACK